MSQKYDPVKVWIRYGLSDLYFGFMNQENNVFRYGVFSYIMAAEKHLKAVLIHEHISSKIEELSTEELRYEADSIAKCYSHKFDKMIISVSGVYESEFKRPFLPSKYIGFEKDDLITAMYEGYIETRYPTINSTSRHFPYKKSSGTYHDPIGSSFFTDFIQLICRNCWDYLLAKGLPGKELICALEKHFGKNEEYEAFKILYLNKLPEAL